MRVALLLALGACSSGMDFTIIVSTPETITRVTVDDEPVDLGRFAGGPAVTYERTFASYGDAGAEAPFGFAFYAGDALVDTGTAHVSDCGALCINSAVRSEQQYMDHLDFTMNDWDSLACTCRDGQTVEGTH